MDPTLMGNFKIVQPTQLTEISQLGRILAQCFGIPIPDEQTFADRVGIENFRLIQQHDRLLGGLQIYRMGQWYGGNRLSIAGIAGVGILPEDRGSGAAQALLSNCLQEFYHDRIPLAVLYASTQRLYRKVGFEQAGTLCRYSVAASSLLPRSRELPMTAVVPQQWEQFVDLYQQQARQTSGNLDRHPALWKRLVYTNKDEIFAYLIGPETAPQGYVIFQQQPAPLTLHIRDFVALTGSAHERLWAFLADHRSTVKNIDWKGPIVHPALLLLPEQSYHVAHLERWFVRVVDVPLALSQRGYPMVEAELHLEVHDDLLPANHGRFILTVEQGQGQVTPGGKGDLTLSVRSLAPLFTGLLTAHQLQQLGYLEGTARGIATANLLFSGPEPWMPDLF